jgi:hypothetical protein
MHGDVTDTWYMPDMQQKGWMGKVSIGTRGRQQNFFHLPLSFFLTKNQKSW